MSRRLPTSAVVRPIRERIRARVRGGEASSRVARPWQFVLTAVSTACFWLAVVLPVAYVPFLGGGLRTGEHWTFFGLLAVHAVVLYAGHEGHDAPTGECAAGEP